MYVLINVKQSKYHGAFLNGGKLLTASCFDYINLLPLNHPHDISIKIYNNSQHEDSA